MNDQSNNQPDLQQERWPDLAGRLLPDEDNGCKRHILPVRVYFEDTDFSALVYHATFLRWCERGRSDFMRLQGNDHHDLFEPGDGGEPVFFVVRRMQIDYLKPARIDEVLTVETRIGEVKAASMTLHQTVWRGRAKLFTARVLIVLISQGGKPQRMSREIRQRFQLPAA